MSKELLEFLAEEARKGHWPNNNFRTSSFIVAAKMISEKFHTTCTADHVENHMRTVRTTWGVISQVRGRSGFGWDDNVKMKYPSHEKYLNKKIDMYDEISIVAGKDIARGNFSKTFGDIQTNSSGQPSTIEVEPTKSDSATSRYHKKRSRNEEEEGDTRHISTQLGEVVSALKKFSDNQLDVEKLYGEIMKMDNVDEAVRVAAFDHLVEREMLARAFLTKSEALRKLWVQNFVKSLC
uniref:Myb/SANT-like domain-containing protein n=1 Tax=Chenopodium quinoa TaxID=63459 RepID=A0A803N906_CHEQI